MSKPRLTDQEVEELVSLINATIRELVFGEHHAGDDELDDALECFRASALNLEQILTLIEGEDE